LGGFYAARVDGQVGRYVVHRYSVVLER